MQTGFLNAWWLHKRRKGTLLNYPVIQEDTFSTPKQTQPDMKYAFLILKVEQESHRKQCINIFPYIDQYIMSSVEIYTERLELFLLKTKQNFICEPNAENDIRQVMSQPALISNNLCLAGQNLLPWIMKQRVCMCLHTEDCEVWKKTSYSVNSEAVLLHWEQENSVKRRVQILFFMFSSFITLCLISSLCLSILLN